MTFLVQTIGEAVFFFIHIDYKNGGVNIVIDVVPYLITIYITLIKVISDLFRT